MKRIGIVLAIAALACGDDDGGTDAGTDTGIDAPMMDDGGMDAGDDDAAMDDGGTDAGPELCEGEAILDPLATDPTFAVIGTDFTSTTVGLLDAAGDVHTDAWIDSGTTGAGLVATLGGDVVFPTTSNGMTIDVLDRFGVDVGTRLCSNGVVVGQLGFSPGEFATNVHDWVIVGNDAWATRYEKNPDGSAEPNDAGNDLIGFDPNTMMLNGNRIDLSEFDEMVTGLDSEGESAMVQVSARPDTVVEAGGVLVVGLGRLPQNLFGDVRGHGEGRVAVVDPSDSSVTGVELTGLANCGQVIPVTGSTTEVVVGCLGYSNVAFGDAAGERANAGIALISIADGVASVDQIWRVSDDDSRRTSVSTLISLGGNLVAAVAPGDFATTNDNLMQIDLESGEQTSIFEASGSFVVGQGAFDGDSLLVVPDSTMGVRRFDTSDDFSEQAVTTIGPAALPPTLIRRL